MIGLAAALKQSAACVRAGDHMGWSPARAKGSLTRAPNNPCQRSAASSLA